MCACCGGIRAVIFYSHVKINVTKNSIAAGRTPADVRAEDLARAGHDMADTAIDMPVDDLRDILDARAFLTSRVTTGSVHPDETRAHRAALAEALPVPLDDNIYVSLVEGAGSTSTGLRG